MLVLLSCDPELHSEETLSVSQISDPGPKSELLTQLASWASRTHFTVSALLILLRNCLSSEEVLLDLASPIKDPRKALITFVDPLISFLPSQPKSKLLLNEAGTGRDLPGHG